MNRNIKYATGDINYVSRIKGEPSHIQDILIRKCHFMKPNFKIQDSTLFVVAGYLAEIHIIIYAKTRNYKNR